MKIKIFYTALLVIFLLSCNKKDFDYPEGKVGASFITKYANFTMNGSRYFVLPPGTTYSEPGVTAEVDGASLPVIIGGEKVNTSASGVYTITYSATNKDGFTTSVARTVVVADIKPSAAANDFSGVYKRTSNQVPSTWKKVAPGVYTVENPGGAAGSTLTVVAVNTEGNKIKIPEQIASDGTSIHSENESYNNATTPNSYTWTIINVGYVNNARTFVKQ